MLKAGAVAHESHNFDGNNHTISFSENGQFLRWFAGVQGGHVISIHHQSINRMGHGIVVEATAEDGVIEAIRWTGRGFVVGVQWHPEFHHADELLDCAPLLEAFLAAAR